MNNECSIVKDLLPLYAENLTSNETADFVKTHLAGCESCRAEYAKLKEPPEAPTDRAAAPLKAVKKKLARKRLLIAACAVLGTALLLFGAFVIFESRPVNQVLLTPGNSEIYTEAEIADAMQAVIKDFENLEGCRLYSLTYAGDEVSAEELAYINEFGKYDQCIVFRSMFRSPIFGGGGWNAHALYYWQWYVGRSPDGTWRVVTKGYA